MRSVLTHAILAVGGLALAWFVWLDGQAPDRVGEGEVTVWDCEQDALQSVHLESDTRDVLLERVSHDGGSVWWVTYRRLEASDDGEGDGEPRVVDERRFVAGESAEEYLERVAPFRALRSLGTVEDERLEELELAEAGARIAIACGGKERTFDVGGSAYGSGDRYLRRTDGGAVYLVASDVVSHLESARSRLMQRDLHRFEMKEVETLTVKGYEQETELLQRNRHTPQRATWVDASKPDRRNELYGNWLSRVERLHAREYLGPDAEPGSELEESVAVEPVVTLVYHDEDGKELGKLEIVKAGSEPPKYYGRSESTRAWVELTRTVAERVEEDARPVLGLEPLPKPDEPDEADAADETAEGDTAAQEEEPSEGAAGERAAGDPHGAVDNPHGGSPPRGNPHGGAASPHGAKPQPADED